MTTSNLERDYQIQKINGIYSVKTHNTFIIFKNFNSFIEFVNNEDLEVKELISLIKDNNKYQYLSVQYLSEYYELQIIDTDTGYSEIHDLYSLKDLKKYLESL